MEHDLNVLLVGMKPELELRLATALGQHQSVRSAADVPSARNLLRGSRAPVVVVRLGEDPRALELVREVTAKGGGVVTVGARKDPDLILAAMRAGAREFIPESEGEQLERAVQALLTASGALRQGKVTAVLSAKGGMGATTLATNLAGALQRRGRRVCLADVDLDLGDVLSFLDVRGTYALADVAANLRRLDRDLLDQSVPRHRSGVWVLSQTEKAAESEALTPEIVGNVVEFLRLQYDHLVLDGAHGFGDVALAALDLADHVVLLVTQEVPAVRNAQRCAEIFQRLGYEPARIALVVNRFQKSSTITREVIEETVGLPVSATLANDFHAVTRAVNRGVLLWDASPGSALTRDVDALAAQLDPEHLAQKKRASLLQKLFPSAAVAHGAR